MNITKKQIEKLDRLQSLENDKRGITCVEHIISCLKRKDIETAFRIRQWDGDKTRAYPKVEKQLEKMFGCRLHGKKNCEGFLCKNKPISSKKKNKV